MSNLICEGEPIVGFETVIPNGLMLDTSYCANEIRLYCIVKSMASQKGYSWPSNQFLMKKFGSSERSIQTWLKNLENGGWIRVIISDGKYRSIHFPNSNFTPQKSSIENAKLALKYAQISRKNDPADFTSHIIEENKELEYKEDIEYKEKNISRSADADLVFSFEDFWRQYGKKRSRFKAEEKFAKISSADRLKIKNTIAQYVKDTPEVRFRQHPLTYLNSRTWMDYEGLPSQTEEENIMTCRFYKLPEKFFQEHFGVSRKDLTERCYYEEIGSIQDVSEKKLKELGRTDFTNWF